MPDGIPCPKCGAKFDSPAAAMEHARREHGVGDPAVASPSHYLCPACKVEFPSREALELHQKAVHDMSASGDPARTLRVGPLLGWGAIGGILGGLGLAGVMAITGNLLGLPVTILAVIAQATVGVSAMSSGAEASGLGMHLLSSLLIGVVLAGIVVGLSRASPRFSRAFLPSSPRRVVTTGLLGGFLVFLIFGLPMMFVAMVPTMQTLMTTMIEMMGVPPAMATAMATSQLNGWMPGILEGFFLGHLVYGLFVSALVGAGTYLQLRRVPRRAGHGSQDSAA